MDSTLPEDVSFFSIGMFDNSYKGADRVAAALPMVVRCKLIPEGFEYAMAEFHSSRWSSYPRKALTVDKT